MVIRSNRVTDRALMDSPPPQDKVQLHSDRSQLSMQLRYAGPRESKTQRFSHGKFGTNREGARINRSGDRPP